MKFCPFPMNFRMMPHRVNRFSYQSVSSTYQLGTPTSLSNIPYFHIILLPDAAIGVFNPGYWSIDCLSPNSLATNSALLH